MDVGICNPTPLDFLKNYNWGKKKEIFQILKLFKRMYFFHLGAHGRIVG
jgi:hypothetical protein